MARHNWGATPVGPVVDWPIGLTSIVQMMLDSAQEMVIWWGPDARQIYNDAYRQRIDKAGSVSALGRPAALDWKDSWNDIGPQFDLILAGKPPTQFEDVLAPICRNSTVEDTYWFYTLTPVRDDTGTIRGALVISRETTTLVLAARRQATINILRQQIAGVSSLNGLQDGLQAAVQFNPDDLPRAHLVGAKFDHAMLEAPYLQGLCINAEELGVDVDLAVFFVYSARLPLDGPYRLFLEQMTLLIAAARLRIDSEARRMIVEQERDRLLLDAPVAAAVMIGDGLVYHLVNALYEQASGRLEKDMVGKSFVEVFPELIGAPVREKFLEVYRSGEPFISPPTLVQIHRHGGALDDRYFKYNLSPLRTLEGKVYGLMVIAVDITVEVEARSEVEKLNIELNAAASAKDEFLALLGHELCNPLAPIVSAIDLMGLRDPSSKREQVIIRRQVKHLTRLVDDLLDVSRITRGKVELRKEDIDVYGVLMSAVEMVLPSIEQRQQQLHVDIASLRWHGDPARLAQIVTNLLTNASRYSDINASIALRTRVIDGEFEIKVSDNGMGLAADLLPHIFEPFIQGARQLRSAVGGLGVGLALVKNLVEMHGGTVIARSDGADQGSTFTVRMPIHLPAYAVHPAELPQETRMTGEHSHILVVDDNADAADTLADLLRLYGHDVTVAYTAEEAMEKFIQQKIAVAILDIGLPGITGYDLADGMRGTCKNADARYIALTGFGQDSDRERSTAARFAGHLVKPVDVEALLALV